MSTIHLRREKKSSALCSVAARKAEEHDAAAGWDHLLATTQPGSYLLDTYWHVTELDGHVGRP